MGRRNGAGPTGGEGPASGEKMRAVGLRRYGPPEVLEGLEVERPEPTSDGVLIRVAAGGVNPADCLLRSGGLRFVARQKMPFVPGADVAGVVEATGPAVTRFEPGDPVYAMLPNTAGGGYAEYAVAAEGTVAAIPPGLTFGEAAGVPLAALTALQALRDRADLSAGDHVLVNGASGGVGTFAVQISRAMGATVTAAASGRNADLVRGLGADEFLDYTDGDVTAGEARYDVVLDATNVLAFRKGPPGAEAERGAPHRQPVYRAPLAGMAGALQGGEADQVRPRRAGRWGSREDRGLDLFRRGEAGDRPPLPPLRRRGRPPPQREPPGTRKTGARRGRETRRQEVGIGPGTGEPIGGIEGSGE